MVRAAGQGHGRNDAATTDPQPRARCSSYAHDAMSVTRDSGSSSTRMFSSLLGSRTPHAGVSSIRIFSLLRGLWMFVLVRVVGVRGYDGRILDADRCEKWRPRCADKKGKRRLNVSTCCIFPRGCRARGQRRRNSGPAASRGPQQGRVVRRSPLTRCQ